MFRNYKKIYVNEDGVRILHPTKKDKKECYCYKYELSSFRLALNARSTTAPLYWINRLVVKLTERKLERDRCVYSPDRIDSNYAIKEREKQKEEQRQKEMLVDFDKTYPWLEEERKKYK